MASVIVGETIKMTVVFYGWNSATSEKYVKDPVTVDLDVLTDLSAATPTVLHHQSAPKIAFGTYYYEWTPSAIGNYRIRFLGTFEDASTDVINQDFEVSLTGVATSTERLGVDSTIYFAGIIDPLYIDPEELKPLFPEATDLEIAEQIHLYSQEVKTMLKLQDDEVPPFGALEYIKAASACSLDRIYGLGTGANVSFTLGDLSINRTGGGRGAVSRATATTWCELAAVLRAELLSLSSRGGLRAVVKGSKYVNPIPVRKIRDIDARGISIHYVRQVELSEPEYSDNA